MRAINSQVYRILRGLYSRIRFCKVTYHLENTTSHLLSNMESNAESLCLLENDGRPVRKELVQDFEKVEKYKKSFWYDTSRRQKWIFVFAALSNASVCFCLGIPTSFLSRVVVAKGGDKLFTPAILGSTMLISSISSLLCGKYQEKIPTKAFIWTGLLAVALSQGCLGLLEYTESIYLFVVMGILLKSIQGFGQGVYNVALLTLLWNEVPDHVEKSFGLTRAMIGVGYLLSTFFSGFLYSIQNGIMIPFTVSATPALILSFFGWLLLDDVKNTRQSATLDYQAWRYICNPKAVFVLGLASTCGGAFVIFAGSFTSYAQSLGVSVIAVSLMSGTGNVAMIVSSLIAGYFANVNHTCRRVSIAILFLAIIGVDLSYNGNESLWMLFIQVTIFVVSASGVRTLAFPEMLHSALNDDVDISKDFSFRSQMSGFWYFASSVQSCVFGVGGTALQDVVSYSMSLTISGLTGFFLTLIATITVYFYRRKQCKKPFLK